jgi:hypothetical protein
MNKNFNKWVQIISIGHGFWHKAHSSAEAVGLMRDKIPFFGPNVLRRMLASCFFSGLFLIHP